MTVARGPQDFSVLYVLGDSISDTGGINGLVLPDVPASYLDPFGYGNGRYNFQDADGDGIDDSASYVNDAVTLFGIAQSIENFAIAGAEALRSRTLEEVLGAPPIVQGGLSVLDTLQLSTELQPPPEENLATVIDADAQLDRILTQYAADGERTGAAALINIGANDYDLLAEQFIDDLAGGLTPEFLAAFIPAALGTIAGVTQTIVEETKTLSAAGFETVIIVDLFADYTPQVQSDPVVASLAEVIIGLNNTALVAAATLLDADPTVSADIEFVRLSALFDEIFADPASFNILNLSQPVYLSLPFGDPTLPGEFAIVVNPMLPVRFAGGENLDQLLFFDLQHLTASSHDIVSAYLAAALQDDLRFLGDGNDTFVDRTLGDLLGRPDDVVFAGLGDDVVTAGFGDDVLFGGVGGDRLDGGVGDDILVGGSGDDDLHGGARRIALGGRDGGEDVLAGGDGDDTLWGGDGADFLADGLGADCVKGGAGRDTLVFVEPSLLGGAPGTADEDVFDGGDASDTLLLFVEDEHLRMEAVAAVKGAAAGGDLGSFAIASLGLSVTAVERVIVFAERRLPLDLDLPARLAEKVEEADAWNAIPLSADGPFSVANAIFDTDYLIA